MSPEDLEIHKTYRYLCGNTDTIVMYLGKSAVWTDNHVFKVIGIGGNIRDVMTAESVNRFIQKLS